MDVSKQEQDMQDKVDEALGMKTIEPEELSVTEAYRQG